MKTAKVKTDPSLIRDLSNQAVLNTDNKALKAYKIKRDKQKELSSSLDEINTLKEEVGEIKNMMKAILEKLG